MSLEEVSLQLASAMLWFHGRFVLVVMVVAGLALVAIGAGGFFGGFNFRALSRVLGSVLIVSLSGNLVGYLLLEGGEGRSGTFDRELLDDACVGCDGGPLDGSEVSCVEYRTCGPVRLDGLPESDGDPVSEALREEIREAARSGLAAAGVREGTARFVELMDRLERGLAQFREGDRLHRVVAADHTGVEWVLCREVGMDSGCALVAHFPVPVMTG